MKLNKLAAAISASIVAATHIGMASAEEVQELSTTVVEVENESSVSHTIKVLSADDISKKSISNIEDTTRYVPGVQVNDAGNRFGDNGFNIRGLQGDAVAVTVDGISLGETLAPASFSAYGMYDSTRGQVELEHVKSISITKGPSSVANGSNALAGAVAYTTNDASDFLNEEGDDQSIRLKTGYDTRSDEMMLGLTAANRTGALESLLQYTKRDGSETEAHGSGDKVEYVLGEDGRPVSTASETEVADPIDVSTDSILAKFAYEVVEGHKVGVLYDRTDRKVEGSPLSRQSGTYYDFDIEDENNKTRIGLFYSWDNAGLAAFDSLSATLDSQELFTSGVTSFGYTNRRAGTSYLRREDRSTTQDSTSLNIDFEKFIDGDISHNIVYGLKWEQREIENVRWDIRFSGLNDTTGIQDGYPERDAAWVPVTETSVINLYASNEMQLTEQLKVSAGIRYDMTEYTPKVDETFVDSSGTAVSDAEFSAFAGEIVSEYEFLPGHTFLASYSQGYKAPSAQQMYLGTDGSGTLTDKYTGVEVVDLDTVTNPDLEAEESSSFEVGYKLESDNASVTVTAFWTSYENLIQNVSLSNPYSQGIRVDEFDFNTFSYIEVVKTADEYSQPQNVGEVDVNGIELDAIYAFTDNLYSRLTFATIEGEYKDSLPFDHDKGDKLETAAPDSGSLTLGYQANSDQWGIALHALWFDKVDEELSPMDAAEQGKEPGDLSFTSKNNGSGPAYYPESYSVFDLTAFYQVSENIDLTAAVYNLTDKEYYRWEVVNSVRKGSGGFFGGVAGDGYKRYSEPGRSFSLNLGISF